MTRTINFSFLNKAELEYEVRIRLEDPATTVLLLRKQILQLALFTPSEDILISPLPIEEDLPLLDSTLNYLDNKIQVATTGDLRYLKLIETYLNHIYYRLDRIDIDLYPNHKSTYDSLKTKFEQFEKQFESFTFLPAETVEPVQVAASVPLPLTPAQCLPALPPYSIGSPPVSTAQAASHMISSPNPLHVFKDLRKYSFNGKSCPRSFLQKLNEYCICRGLNKDLLISQAYELFTDNALHWFRYVYGQNPNLTWDELSQLLIQNFSEYDYDYKLLEAIKTRTQGRDEPIIIYISIISGMFSRLSKKLSEADKLEIILRNIRPCYSVFVALKDIVSIESLVATCQNYERFMDRDKQFKEPVSLQHPLTAEFNYKYSVSNSTSSQNSTSVSNSTSKPSPNPQTPTSFNKFRSGPSYNSGQVNALNQPKLPDQNIFCYRCRIHGHNLMTCTQPHFLICFKCGLKGYKLTDCPKCNNLASPSDNQKN